VVGEMPFPMRDVEAALFIDTLVPEFFPTQIVGEGSAEFILDIHDAGILCTVPRVPSGL
jgi:hypothetical protein